MASKLRARTRRKPTHAKAKAAQRAGNVRRAQKAKKAQVDRRAAENQDKARSGQLKNRRGNQATGGESTARESGIMASQKANKIKGLEQSVGSLDRRINKAIEGGNLDLAKDLRSRQNKFTTDLGLERAIEAGGVLRDKEGRIVRSSTTGQPVMTTAGRDIFSQTKDMDFIDPTRRIQNVGGKAYGQMYPISSYLQKGPAVVQGLKSLFDKGKQRDIPYTDPMMPGERYPLDEGYGRGEGATFFGGRSRDPNYTQDSFSAPLEDVSISDMVISDEDDDQENRNRILESQGIDPNFIYPGQDGEPGNTALQLAYDDEVEAALLKNLASHLDSQGRYSDKLPNPFFYDEQQKIKLREEAIKNQTPLTEAQIKTLEDKGVSRHFDHLYPDTPLTKQTLSDVVDRENTTFKQVGADLGADTLNAIGTLSGLNYFPPYDNMANAAENYADSLDMTETSMEDINNNIAAAKAQLAEQYNWLNEDQINSLYDYNNQQSLF
jgi:hypothetical protein